MQITRTAQKFQLWETTKRHVFYSTCPSFICRNAEGVHVHVSECLRGTWETKGWEPLL